MAKLKRKSVPLTIYSQVIDWFHRENGDINKHQKLVDVVDGGYMSWKTLVKLCDVPVAVFIPQQTHSKRIGICAIGKILSRATHQTLLLRR
jgi:hypothetical protein